MHLQGWSAPDTSHQDFCPYWNSKACLVNVVELAQSSVCLCPFYKHEITSASSTAKIQTLQCVGFHGDSQFQNRRRREPLPAQISIHVKLNTRPQSRLGPKEGPFDNVVGIKVCYTISINQNHQNEFLSPDTNFLPHRKYLPPLMVSSASPKWERDGHPPPISSPSSLCLN